MIAWSLSRRARWVALAALLIMPSLTQAANVPLAGTENWGESLKTHFDPLSRQTRVTGRVLPELCFSLRLPQEWHSIAGGFDSRLKAASSDAELAVSLRSVNELRGMPQSDLASRDAALLQKDYENLLGRPAQSVTLASLANGASRWSATWYDAQLPTDSYGMTIEAFIVPLSGEWVLELSLTNIRTKRDYDALVQELLAGLKVQHRPGCSG